jgi:hypothetical protein
MGVSADTLMRDSALAVNLEGMFDAIVLVILMLERFATLKIPV